MKFDEKILNRFDELLRDAEAILRTSKDPPRNSIGFPVTVDSLLLAKWQASTMNLLRSVFGRESVHFQAFEKESKARNSLTQARRSLGILQAAREDFEKGYLFNTRLLIEAEVFDDFLEQAAELYGKGYFQASAVIAGCVLEDALRRLCIANEVEVKDKATIDPLNSGLAKAGIYSKLVQKRVTALADLRNRAAHGDWESFEAADVDEMIQAVRRFLEEYLH